MGHLISESVLGVLENLPNVELTTSYFRLDLLQDKDDNKFVDCAIAPNADYIVTHDHDFDILTRIPFPKVQVVGSNALKEIIGVDDGTI